jgi:hypothetical protein
VRGWLGFVSYIDYLIVTNESYMFESAGGISSSSNSLSSQGLPVRCVESAGVRLAKWLKLWAAAARWRCNLVERAARICVGMKGVGRAVVGDALCVQVSGVV